MDRTAELLNELNAANERANNLHRTLAASVVREDALRAALQNIVDRSLPQYVNEHTLLRTTNRDLMGAGSALDDAHRLLNDGRGILDAATEQYDTWRGAMRGDDEQVQFAVCMAKWWEHREGRAAEQARAWRREAELYKRPQAEPTGDDGVRITLQRIAEHRANV